MYFAQPGFFSGVTPRQANSLFKIVEVELSAGQMYIRPILRCLS